MSGPQKGMVAGQPIKTDAVTREYEAGYERTFGKPSGKRGRWIWDPASKRLVTPGEYRPAPEKKALYAPVMVDRYLEGARSPVDGSDIGSRRKHKEHMRRHGLTTADDYTQTWEKKAKEREALYTGTDSKTRKEWRDAADRAWYQHTGY